MDYASYSLCQRWPARLICLALVLACADVGAKTFSGLVYPVHDITLSAGVAGLVMRREVQLGQHVKADQVLLQLDDRTQAIESNRRKVIFEDQSEVNAARERLRILNVLLKDAQAVFNATGSVSKDELLRLEAEQLAASARVDQLVEQKKREKLDFESAEHDRLQRRITAPVNGVITKLAPQVGEWAKPGDAVISLVDASTVILRLAVPHTEAKALRVGANQVIKTEPSDSAVPVSVVGRVSFVSPVADPASGLVQVEITFNNPRYMVKPGTKGTIDLQVPTTAKPK
jgi:RND family efflux transporter MFP subunit